MSGPWNVNLHEAFESEFDELRPAVQEEIFALAAVLKVFGPQLGRPRVDTLKGSKYPNMKELRFKSDDGVWRVAFAFDPERQAVLLVAGDKSGVSQAKFYKELIAKADKRFSVYLKQLSEEVTHG